MGRHTRISLLGKGLGVVCECVWWCGWEMLFCLHRWDLPERHGRSHTPHRHMTTRSGMRVREVRVAGPVVLDAFVGDQLV